jgi:hypothetical protein
MKERLEKGYNEYDSWFVSNEHFEWAWWIMAFLSTSRMNMMTTNFEQYVLRQMYRLIFVNS